MADFKYTDNGKGTLTVVEYSGKDTSVTIPATINGMRVTVIGEDLFCQNCDITTVVIPNTVEHIFAGAFKCCTNLKKVIIFRGGKLTIGDMAFSLCKSLEEISLENVTDIGFLAFGGCDKLDNISLDNVKSIGFEAFRDCISLKQITIPSCTEKLGERAFNGCSMLNYVVLPSKLYNSDIIGSTFLDTPFYNRTQLMSNKNAVSSSETTGNTVKTIDGYLLSENGDGTWAIRKYIGSQNSVNILSQRNDGRVVTRIMSGAFSKCQISAVYIDEGITEIDDGAFMGNTELYYAELPDSLKKLGPNAFTGCEKLVYARLPDRFDLPKVVYICFGNTPFLLARSGKPIDRNVEMLIKSNGDGTWALKRFIGSNINPVLNHEMKDKRILTKILPYAFRCRQDVKSVTIPEGYTEICTDAFNGCKNLSDISLPKSIKTLGEGAFRGCGSLKNIYVPEHLKNTEMLKNAIIGTPAYDRMFGSKNNTEPSVPVANGEDIVPNGDGTWGLAKYSGKGKVVLIRAHRDGKFVRKILKSAFAGRDDIISVFIDEGITEIGRDAFCGCKNLCFVALPKSLNIVCIDAFKDCRNLSRVLAPVGLNLPKRIMDVFPDTPLAESYDISEPLSQTNSGMVLFSKKKISDGFALDPEKMLEK